MKSLKVRQEGALVGAIAWTFNAYIMVWLEYEQYAVIAAMLPLTLLCVDHFLKRPSAPLFITLAAVLSYTMWSAHVHWLIYQLLVTEGYILFRVFITSNYDRRPIIKSVALFLLLNSAICCGAVMSSGIIAMYGDTYRHSQRAAMPFSTLLAETGRMPFYYLITMLFPKFLGSPVQGYFISPPTVPEGYNNYNELCVYAGITVLLLASVSLLAWRRNRTVLFFLVVALLSLCMAGGTIFYYPFATFVPGLNLSTPLRTLYVFGFSIALLAGFGADYLWRLRGPKRGFLLAPAFCILLLTLCIGAAVQSAWGRSFLAQIVVPDGDQSHLAAFKNHLNPLSSVILQPMVIAATMFAIMLTAVLSGGRRGRKIAWALCIVILAYELISFGRSYNTASPRSLEYPKTGAICFLQKDHSLFRVLELGTWKFLHNTLCPFGIDCVRGFAAMNPRRFNEYAVLSETGSRVPASYSMGRWVCFLKADSPLLDLVNMKYVCVPPMASLPGPDFSLVYENEIRIFENRNCFPRAFFVDSAVTCAGAEDAFATVGGFTRNDFRKKVVLETGSAPAAPAAAPVAAAAKHAAVSIAEVNANTYSATAFCPSDGFLVISNGFHQGWRAIVDGKEAPVLRANYIMQAVPVSAGSHTVKLVFRPLVIIAGLAVSGMTWCAVAVYFIILALLAVQQFLKKRQRQF